MTSFTAVIINDWILTLPDEIRVIWSGKMTGAKVLFLLNRYLWIALYVVSVMGDQLMGVSDIVSTSICDYDGPADPGPMSRGALTLQHRPRMVIDRSCVQVFSHRYCHQYFYCIA